MGNIVYFLIVPQHAQNNFWAAGQRRSPFAQPEASLLRTPETQAANSANMPCLQQSLNFFCLHCGKNWKFLCNTVKIAVVVGARCFRLPASAEMQRSKLYINFA